MFATVVPTVAILAVLTYVKRFVSPLTFLGATAWRNRQAPLSLDKLLKVRQRAPRDLYVMVDAVRVERSGFR